MVPRIPNARQFGRLLTYAAGGLAVLLAQSSAQAGEATAPLRQGGKAQDNFRAVLDYFPNGSPKSILEGKSAAPQKNGHLLIENLRLTLCEAPGKTNLLVESPLCYYDASKKIAYSSGPFKGIAEEGKFTVEGEGFHWRYATGDLVISNQVRTLVDRHVLDEKPPE